MTKRVKKIEAIEKTAVFREFHWDSSVKKMNGDVAEFTDINIIYGRNYSGKTTLSRIFRAMEIGELCEHFENSAFRLSFIDNGVVTQNRLTDHETTIRVFNEDFVRENLKFIFNPEDTVEAFAVLGDGNVGIQREIDELESRLGVDADEDSTGLYAERRNAKHASRQNEHAFNDGKDRLEKQLREKAINKDIGIKYQSDRFGDQNYDVTKFRKDLSKVKETNYKSLSDEKVTQCENLIQEKPLHSIPPLNCQVLKFEDLVSKSKVLVNKHVSKSAKIDRLVENPLLNQWVKDGIQRHESRRDSCGFCDNLISEDRWTQLERHFDKESEEFVKEIEELIEEINEETNSVEVLRQSVLHKSQIYSRYHEQIDEVENLLEESTIAYIKSLRNLTSQLCERKNNIFGQVLFKETKNFSEKLSTVLFQYEELRTQANDYTESLSQDQTNAKHDLRLNEVYKYQIEIGYENQLDSISALEEVWNESRRACDEVDSQIENYEQLLDSKRGELNDESKGAAKVNEYLNNYFENQYLTLRTVQDEKSSIDSPQTQFEILRNGERAYNLSEGECRLIAFCYFMAKLEDINTKNSKPIIWIDDPVSSLDSNHIFFVYSLLRTQIVDSNSYAQLFISTHNLEFLKYLKMMKGTGYNDKKGYFIVSREIDSSTLQVMPKYLKNYVTEFNFLFDHIYRCSELNSVDDGDHSIVYNFANDARKFLEIYLYYKYPNQGMNPNTLKIFFGDDDLSSTIASRLLNEYSHMKGVLERGTTPMELPEARQIAKKILIGLQRDDAQYSDLLRSIGIDPESV